MMFGGTKRNVYIAFLFVLLASSLAKMANVFYQGKGMLLLVPWQ